MDSTLMHVNDLPRHLDLTSTLTRLIFAEDILLGRKRGGTGGEKKRGLFFSPVSPVFVPSPSPSRISLGGYIKGTLFFCHPLAIRLVQSSSRSPSIIYL